MTQVTFEDSIVKMRHFGSFSHTMRTRVNMAGIRPHYIILYRVTQSKVKAFQK